MKTPFLHIIETLATADRADRAAAATATTISATATTAYPYVVVDLICHEGPCYAAASAEAAWAWVKAQPNEYWQQCTVQLDPRSPVGTPIRVAECSGCEYYAFHGLRGLWNRTYNEAATCLPSYHWRHEPLTEEEGELLEQAARAAGYI